MNSQQIAAEMRGAQVGRSGYTGSASPPQPTRLSESICRLEEALGDLQRECERAEGMADRLLGPIPKDQVPTGSLIANHPGGSVADQIEGLSNRLLATRGRLTNALERLQQL